ncbi:unnamed protein product [Protopolystoma xenopodis]|uniref:Secreted protein n=1 Tax=Protopolystoma xenopodis TaxID=117903 RepID=A0A448WYZ9_9PLAT|nr:unnamed protein product [Protopolystoma xenopodis]
MLMLALALTLTSRGALSSNVVGISSKLRSFIGSGQRRKEALLSWKGHEEKASALGWKGLKNATLKDWSFSFFTTGSCCCQAQLVERIYSEVVRQSSCHDSQHQTVDLVHSQTFRRHRGQSLDECSAKNGYTITPFSVLVYLSTLYTLENVPSPLFDAGNQESCHESRRLQTRYVLHSRHDNRTKLRPRGQPTSVH